MLRGFVGFLGFLGSLGSRDPLLGSRGGQPYDCMCVYIYIYIHTYIHNAHSSICYSRPPAPANVGAHVPGRHVDDCKSVNLLLHMDCRCLPLCDMQIARCVL